MKLTNMADSKHVTYTDTDESYQNFLEEVASNPYEFLHEIKLPVQFTKITFVRFSAKKRPAVKKVHDKVEEIVVNNTYELIGKNVLAVYFEDGEPDIDTFRDIYRRVLSRFRDGGQIYIRK